MDQCMSEFCGFDDSNIEPRKNIQKNPSEKADLQMNRNQSVQSLEHILLTNNMQITPSKRTKINFNYKKIPVGSNPIFRTNNQLQKPNNQYISYQQPIQHIRERSPQPKVWWERVPYDKRVIDYEARMVWVPVERIQRSQYAVQHVIDYVRQEVIEQIPVIQPRQVTGYKLQYVPVDKQIIHLPQSIVKREGQGVILHQENQLKELNFKQKQAPYYKQRTQYVTSQDWQMGKNQRLMDEILMEIQGIKNKQSKYLEKKINEESKKKQMQIQ